VRRDHRGLPILAGGPALTTNDEAMALGADGFAPDGVAAAALIRALTTPNGTGTAR
jgi:hypothetical protein